MSLARRNMRTEQNQRQDHATSPIVTSRAFPILSAAIAAGVFIVDTVTPAEIVFSVLYVGVVLLSAGFLQGRGIALAALVCMALTVLSYFLSPPIGVASAAIANRLISLAAIGVTAFLAVQGRSREMVLREQADLLDLTHDTIFVRDLNDVITYWNRGAEGLYGWDRREAVGKVSHQLLQTIFPKPLEEIMAELRRADRWEGELVHTRKDGTQAIVASRWSMQRDTRGRPVAILETNNDITERKRAEEAARRSEQELRDLIENLPAMVYIGLPGPSGPPFAAFASRGWREYSGLSQEDTAGSGWQSAVHPADLERNLKKWQACAAAGEPYESEARFRRAADGAYRWFLDRAVPLKDEQGAILKWYGVLTDIEDRKRAEDALRRSEHYLTEAQRLSHTGSWAYNPATGKAIYWSDEMFRIHGLDPQGDPAPDLNELPRFWHPDDRDRALEHARTAIREKAEYAIEQRIALPDGTIKHLHAIGHPVFDDAGALVEYFGTVMDITERKRAEEALNKAQAELAHVTRVTTMGVLTSSIAHEVNQPLGAIVTNANAALRWLTRQPPELDEARETLERIAQDGHRAGEVIERVRALLQKKAAVAERVNLNDLIQDTFTLVHGEMVRHRILLRAELAPDLPRVVGDRVQLQQVLLNLVLNGIEAMKDVTERPRELLIRSQPNGSGAVLVTVQDTGVGLDPQSVERVFEAFYTTKPDGMGMGLAICRSIVAAHGGRLWASVNEPRSTTFQFTLPVNQDETGHAERAA